MQRVCQFFGPSANNKAAGAMPAHDQSLQLHRPKSFANRCPADAQTFGKSTLRRKTVTRLQPALLQQTCEPNHDFFVHRSLFCLAQRCPQNKSGQAT